MRTEARGAGSVIDLPDDRHLARALRTWLRFAGHDGPELERSATRAALTWHDLRATGISWRAGRGDDPTRIMVAAGHSDFATTQKYIRRGAIVSAGAGVFPELPPIRIVSESSELTRSRLASLRNHKRISVEAQGIEPGSITKSHGKQAATPQNHPHDLARFEWSPEPADDSLTIGRRVLGDLAMGLGALRGDPLEAYAYGGDLHEEGGADG
jgi:hypothetical protein